MTINVNALTDRELILLVLNRNTVDHEVMADIFSSGTVVEIEGNAGYVEFKFNQDGRLEAVIGDR